MKNYDREYWVYRAYGVTGVLLYVGCTRDRKARRMSHRRESVWFPHAARFHQSGPFEKEAAFRTEKDAIQAERPWFNSRPGDQRHNRRISERASEILTTRYGRGGFMDASGYVLQSRVDAAYADAEAELGARITPSSRLTAYLDSVMEVAA